nr:unnamed protein product [Callosobruchus analis]
MKVFLPAGKKQCHVKAYSAVWHEGITGRNKEDVVSAYYAFFLQYRYTKCITLWVDNCSAQNKNWCFLCFLVHIVNSDATLISKIVINYFELGHTYSQQTVFTTRSKNVRSTKRKCPTSMIFWMLYMYKLYDEKCSEENKPSHFYIKYCTYSKIFSTEFNLSFGKPRSDTCSTCDGGKGVEEHIQNYNEAFSLQRIDREYAKSNNGVCYLTMDLKQTIPLLRLTTSKAFIYDKCGCTTRAYIPLLGKVRELTSLRGLRT